MDARNFTYMFYGFFAAWAIVLLYLFSLARRASRLKRELEDVKRLLSLKETSAKDSGLPARS
jgi:CcmD family protein